MLMEFELIETKNVLIYNLRLTVYIFSNNKPFSLYLLLPAFFHSLTSPVRHIFVCIEEPKQQKR